jgi:hypothetical protein
MGLGASNINQFTGINRSQADARYQPLNANLTTIAGLTVVNGKFLVGRSGAWAADVILSADLTTPLTTPPAIGGSTPAAGAFTTLSASSDLTLSGAPGKIKPGADATNALQIANAAGTAFATFDTSNSRFMIGQPTPAFQIHTANGNGAADAGIATEQNASSVAAAVFLLRKSRNSFAAPTTVANNDFIGIISGVPHDGTNYLKTARIAFKVNGTVGTASVPTDIIFTAGAIDDGNLTNERLRIGSTGVLIIPSTGKLNIGNGTLVGSSLLQVFGDIFGNSGGALLLRGGANADQIFRGVRASSGWSDALDTTFFQIGQTTGNSQLTAASGGTLNRFGIIASATQIAHVFNATAPVGFLEVRNSVGALFNILTTGATGINTTTPGAALQVNGYASAVVSIFRANATTPGDIAQFQTSTPTTVAKVDNTGLGFFAGLNITDAKNIVLGTTTGTKIGTVGGAAGQKLGFFNANPIVQPLLATGAGATVDNVITALQNLGLVRQT